MNGRGAIVHGCRQRNGQLVLPDDLTQMLQWAYVAGARIHSNSWGTTTSEYTATALDMDRFMYNNKDMLVVVAAGNDGSCDFDMTIGSPATAKVGYRCRQRTLTLTTALERHLGWSDDDEPG